MYNELNKNYEEPTSAKAILVFSDVENFLFGSNSHPPKYSKRIDLCKYHFN